MYRRRSLWNFGDCISDDSYRNPGSAVSGSQTEALEQGLRRIGIRRWYPLFCKCLCMTLLLMAVTAGGYGWAVQKGYALAGRKNSRRGG
ncbi:MAG: hypothetical protein ACLR3S_10555 [Clostridium fessum]